MFRWTTKDTVYRRYLLDFYQYNLYISGKYPMKTIKDVERRIQSIRPPLRLVAPLTFYVTLGYGLFNLALGGLLYHTRLATTLRITGVLSVRWWGFIFGLHGLITLYALFLNNWTRTKQLMVVGALIKTVWLMELISEAILGSSIILVFIWGLLLYVQVATYIYFTPVNNYAGR